MTKKKSITSSLRALSLEETSIDDWSEFNRQINEVTNDRGACILLATNVDIALTDTIFRILHWDDDTREALTGQDGPVSTFARKITLGRALRIYGPDTEFNLNMVRHIRNAFAHAHKPIGFETMEVVDAVAALKELAVLFPHAVESTTGKRRKPTTTRERYADVCSVLAHNLIVHGTGMFHELSIGDNERHPETHDTFLWQKPLP